MCDNFFFFIQVPDNGQISHQIPATDQEKSLLTVVNPVQKPPRRYEPPPTQLSELNRNLLDDTGMRKINF